MWWHAIPARLTDKLRDHLVKVANNNDENAAGTTTSTTTSSSSSSQPVIFDASKTRMSQTANYVQSASADNVAIFHGREIRQVPDAAGGMGMVLQLSLASSSEAEEEEKDPQGWTAQEIQRYDGWGHDSGREWRKAQQLHEEGFSNFAQQFGPSAYSLHHRFYLHHDRANRLWLSAEDGCEGTPVDVSPNKKSGVLSNLFGNL